MRPERLRPTKDDETPRTRLDRSYTVNWTNDSLGLISWLKDSDGAFLILDDAILFDYAHNSANDRNGLEPPNPYLSNVMLTYVADGVLMGLPGQTPPAASCESQGGGDDPLASATPLAPRDFEIRDGTKVLSRDGRDFYLWAEKGKNTYAEKTGGTDCGQLHHPAEFDQAKGFLPWGPGEDNLDLQQWTADWGAKTMAGDVPTCDFIVYPDTGASPDYQAGVEFCSHARRLRSP